MTIEHGIIRLLLVISLLIVVPGGWMSGEQFLEARTFHRWSTESGCGIPGSVVDWCSPEGPAEAAETAARHRKAAIQYGGVAVTLVVALWAAFFPLRWVVQGFQGPKRGRRRSPPATPARAPTRSRPAVSVFGSWCGRSGGRSRGRRQGERIPVHSGSGRRRMRRGPCRSGRRAAQGSRSAGS
jgi:hypothetical protein